MIVKNRKIIVVGASSGIGAEIAKQLLSLHSSVTFIARRKSEIEKRITECGTLGSDSKPFIIEHDVKNVSEVPALFEKAVADMGGLDEIYFAAGIMHKVSMDEFNTAKDIEMMQVNTLGAIAWINLAAAYFSSKGKGKIIGISSIAGDRGRVGNPVYNTSKAALNTYLEALRNRLSRKGTLVMTVKPGFIDTDMTKGMQGLFWLISAEKAAEIILSSADRNKENIYVPWKWSLVALIIKNIPNFIFKKLNV